MIAHCFSLNFTSLSSLHLFFLQSFLSRAIIKYSMPKAPGRNSVEFVSVAFFLRLQCPLYLQSKISSIIVYWSTSGAINSLLNHDLLLSSPDYKLAKDCVWLQLLSCIVYKSWFTYACCNCLTFLFFSYPISSTTLMISEGRW